MKKKVPALDNEQLLSLYRGLLKIRRTELKIEQHYPSDEMKTPVHLPLGQEAVSVGVCAHLTKHDYVFSNHRSHAHYLAKGGDLKAMIAELYCKETGCSKGRGGSMHLIDTSVGLLGSSSIVGGSIPHAVGAAFASVYRNEKRIAISFFGDGAAEEGVLYESMNFAALKKLPVIFACENNFYSVCSHLSARQPNHDIYKRASAFGITSFEVDGMNIFDVYQKSGEAINYVRAGKGPYFLEFKVQRWRGHAGPDDPIAEEYRIPEDLDETKRRDPVADFEKYLLTQKKISPNQLDEIHREIDQQIGEAFKFAQESPLPKVEDLEKYLYS